MGSLSDYSSRGGVIRKCDRTESGDASSSNVKFSHGGRLQFSHRGGEWERDVPARAGFVKRPKRKRERSMGVCAGLETMCFGGKGGGSVASGNIVSSLEEEGREEGG